MGKNTLRNIGIASLVLGGIATAGVTCSVESRFSKALEERPRVEKLADELNRAKEKVSLPKEKCNEYKERMSGILEKSGAPADLLLQKRFWLADIDAKKCGFFYPKGKGYSVVNPRPECVGQVYRNDGYLFYEKILRYAKHSDSFYDLREPLIEWNPVAAAVFFRYSTNNDVISIGNEWGSWLGEKDKNAREIYAKLSTISGSNGRNNGSDSASAQVQEGGADLALSNVKYVIEGKGFPATGTGVDPTGISRDYFSRFIDALESGANGVKDPKLYSALLKSVNQLRNDKKKVDDALKQLESAPAKPSQKNMQQRIKALKLLETVRGDVMAALELLRKGSPGSADYLYEWFYSRVNSIVAREMFASLYESLALKYTGAPTLNRFRPDDKVLALLLQTAKEIRESAEQGKYQNSDDAMAVAGQIIKLVGNFRWKEKENKVVQKSKDAQVNKDAGRDMQKSKDAQVNKNTGRDIQKSKDAQVNKDTGRDIQKSEDAQATKDAGRDMQKSKDTQVNKNTGRIQNDMSDSADTQDVKWEEILQNSECFDDAQKALIAAEIEEIARINDRNAEVLSQLPQKKNFYMLYIAAILMLAGAGYLAFSKKDDE